MLRACQYWVSIPTHLVSSTDELSCNEIFLIEVQLFFAFRLTNTEIRYTAVDSAVIRDVAVCRRDVFNSCLIALNLAIYYD